MSIEYYLVFRIGNNDYLVTYPDSGICQYSFSRFTVGISLCLEHAVGFNDYGAALMFRDLLNKGLAVPGYFEPKFLVIDKETALKEFRNEEE